MQPELVLLVFAITLVLSVLQSGLFRRTAFSNSLLFLIVGFAVGILGWLSLLPSTPAVSVAVELALVSVLFTDSMRLNFDDLREIWQLPGRTLLLGMPLTFILIAVLAMVLFQLPLQEALLVGAVLSPTDPALASDLLERDAVSLRVRRLLNIESGLNDGLALPVILILLRGILGENPELPQLTLELVGGAGIGIVVPWLIHKLANSRLFSVEAVYYPTYVFSVGVLVFALSKITGMNAFIAAFCAGLMVGSLDEQVRDAFQTLGRDISELLKLVGLFIFGALLTPALFLNSDVVAYVFACLVLMLGRPVAIFAALANTDLSRLEKVTVAWFGPKGFSSLFYVLLVWQVGIPHQYKLFGIMALTLVISIVAHSSTGLLFARQFQREGETVSE